MDEAEKRISDQEDNTEHLECSSKGFEKILKIPQEWNNQEMWDTMKDQTSASYG